MDEMGLRGLRGFLEYLIESGVHEIDVPRSTEAGPRWEDGAAARRAVDPEERLKSIREKLGECTRCPLSRTRRTIVFGEGRPDADVLFVGEAPGSEEDRTGRPFVGKAGSLLTRIIERGMKISRTDVYIGNILKCRPPLNRTPREEEVQACLPFLKMQIAAIRPRAIVTLGLPAVRALAEAEGAMHRLRGRWHAFEGIPLMPTYHPAYVLRNYTPEIRRQVWDDVVEVMRFLGDG